MRTIILATAILLTVISCSKEDNPSTVDPNAMISIRPTATKTKTSQYLPDIEIVRQAYDLNFRHDDFPGANMRRGFIDAHKDTANVRLLMWGTDIIDQDGNYVTEFIDGKDFIIRRNLVPSGQDPIYDTIAFIPQSVIIAARAQIFEAYQSGNFDAVYSLFDTAFTFHPTTGEEWRALKEQGNN